jgi:hypothetical protein
MVILHKLGSICFTALGSVSGKLIKILSNYKQQKSFFIVPLHKYVLKPTVAMLKCRENGNKNGRKID